MEKIKHKHAYVDFEAFENSLGYTFKDKSILSLALTHPSNGLKESNQRLEFLGDSILSAVLSEKLYQDHTGEDEGFLTALRSALSRGEFICLLSKRMGLAKYLILPESPDGDRIRGESSSMEDAFEAIIGAVFLDSNFDTVKNLILKIYKLNSIDVDKLLQRQNPKGALQELAAKSGEKVIYELVSESGLSHQKEFTVKASVFGKSAVGKSSPTKKKAEASAAENLLKVIND